MGQLQRVARKGPGHRSAVRRHYGVKESEIPMSSGPWLMTLQLNPRRHRRRVRHLAEQEKH